MHQQQTSFEIIVGKGEIAHYEQFLLFPQCFLLYQIIRSPLVHIFAIISVFAAELEDPKIGISGKGLKNPERDLPMEEKKMLATRTFSIALKKNKHRGKF